MRSSYGINTFRRHWVLSGSYTVFQQRPCLWIFVEMMIYRKGNMLETMEFIYKYVQEGLGLSDANTEIYLTS